MNTGLCQPANIILIVSAAGFIYELITLEYYSAFWWFMVGIFGSGTFQLLCFGGLSPLAWILMMIPVLIVCFFMAIAIFASHIRINNVHTTRMASCMDADECSPEPATSLSVPVNVKSGSGPLSGPVSGPVCGPVCGPVYGCGGGI